MEKQDRSVQNKHSKSINGEPVNSFGDLVDTFVGAITGSNELNDKKKTDENEEQNNLEPPKYT